MLKKLTRNNINTYYSLSIHKLVIIGLLLIDPINDNVDRSLLSTIQTQLITSQYHLTTNH